MRITMLIEVTQDDINSGCRGDTSDCPIARAIKRATLTKTCVNVGTHKVYFDKVTAILPSNASLAILSYDRGGDMLPFSFELFLPE